MKEKNALRVCLCHLDVARGRLNENLAQAEELSRRAAREEADIIVLPEMALSGYGFDSRAELAHLAVSADDPRLDRLRGLCRNHNCYLVLGLAELEPLTGLVFNSALMWGPDGTLRARRRKVTAESKWAAAGPGSQPQSICHTPWGKVGLMICSEAYYSLVPRGLALAGADLLLSPANWPPGGLDPADLWRIRAIENGVCVAACNRTGQDKRLNCTSAESVAFDSQGECLARYSSASSGLVGIDLPLVDGRLDQSRRMQRLRTRQPRRYAYLAHDLRAVSDLTGLFGLPEPGPLRLYAACPSEDALTGPEALGRWLEGKDLSAESLVLLPQLDDSFDSQSLAVLAGKMKLSLAARQSSDNLTLTEAGGSVHEFESGSDKNGEPNLIDLAHVRVALIRDKELMHPEAAVVLAKRGCDVALASAGHVNSREADCLAARSLDKIAIAVATPDGGLMAVPPKGHNPWQETKVARGHCVGLDIATGSLRDKSTLERIDINLLLMPGAEPGKGGANASRD